MGLNIRLHNITSDNNFLVEYQPSGYTGTYLTGGTYTQGTTSVVLSGMTLNTKYYVRVTDVVTGQYVIQTITTNFDENCYECFT